MIAPSAKETTEVRVTAVVRDGNAAQELESEIARLKGVELALREREKELTEAHRIARLGTWRWDRASDTVTWSDEVYRTFECDPSLPPPGYEEIQKLHTPESRERLAAAVALAIKEGKPYELDVELTMPSGTRKWILSRGEVKAYVDGEATQLGGTIQDITERKLSEGKLVLSESRYRSLIRTTSEIVWTGSAEGLQIEGGPEWQTFTGQSHQEMLGYGWADAIHPDDRASTVAAWNEAVATGKTFQVEQRLRRRDGVYRNMVARAVPSRDASGNIIEWVGMHTDITEQRLAENALRASEERFRKLYESDLIGIGFPDPLGGINDGNDELLRIVGYSRDDIKAGLVRWDRMTPPEYRELDALHLTELAEPGSCTPYEKEYIRKDGARVPILCGYARVAGSSNESIGFILDLTSRKEAEEALREREQRFRDLAESLPLLVWESNPLGRRIYNNERFIEYAGSQAENLLGDSWQRLVHAEDLPRTLDHWFRCMQTGEPYLNEYRLRRHDGAYRYFLARAVPVRNKDGHIERWLGSATDIHDQKLAEEALRRSEKLAATGRLAASIAHEINNPLAAVTNTLYLALRDESLNDSTRNYLATAEQELARVAQVTTQTLRFHRQSTAPTHADLSGIMESAFSLFAARFRASSIQVTQECETHEQLYCYGDELRQVFANLIGNALDATPEGGRLRIRIRRAHSWGSPRTDGLRVIVADTGHGIPVELRKRIFEPFFSTKDDTGTGLGLWVTETILQKHLGRIAVRSRTGSADCGTVFSLFFPFAGISSEADHKK
jgi:PAS domain S-box-containing protein